MMLSAPRFSRRGVLTGFAALGAAALMPGLSRAQPLASGPITIGALKVTPLMDGLFSLPLNVIPDAASPAGAALLKGKGIDAAGPIPIPVNAFLVEKAGRYALIDAGTGPAGGAALGKVAGALAAAGVAPDKIETLIITHLHVDHAGGAIDAKGKALFPNAEMVIQQTEIEFWTDDGIRSRAPAGMDGYFGAARAALGGYRGRVRAVTGEADLWGGLTGLPEPGHTPGHMGVMIADGGEHMLMWTDIMHVGLLQFPHPDWSVLFDVNRTQATDTRAHMLDRLSADGTRVMGSHLADRGRIAREQDGFVMLPA